LPPAKKKKDDTESKSRLTITLDDTTLAVPTLDSLTINEVFAVLSATGIKAEVLWQIDLDQPIGRATLSVWWWIARSRETKVMLPFPVASAELDAAANDGKTLSIGFTADEVDDPEA
jgi:hypothetical protein